MIIHNAYSRFRQLLSRIKRLGFRNEWFLYRYGRMLKTEDYSPINPKEKDLKRVKKEAAKQADNIKIVRLNTCCDKQYIFGLNEELKNEPHEYFLFLDTETDVCDFTLWAFKKRVAAHSEAEVIYADEKIGDDFIFKPDFAPDTFNSGNYIGNSVCIRKDALEKIDFFSAEAGKAFLYDALFRILETESKERVEKRFLHIQKPLFFREKEYDFSVDGDVIKNHLDRINADYSDIVDLGSGIFDIKYNLKSHPLVSIIIPNKDNVETLKTCIESIVNKSTYANYEIVIIENNSTEKETFAYYDRIGGEDNIYVKKTDLPWNYSAINNFATTKCKGEYYILLNNDTEVVAPDWIEQMLAFAERDNVGAVGAKLYFPDGTIQHGGVTVGIRAVAGHAFMGFPGDSRGYMDRLVRVMNLSAVTAACIMIPKRVFDEIDGLDEKYKVAFNDTDLCMRIRKQGYYIVYNPDVVLKHYESKTRGSDETSPEKLRRFNEESLRFQREWCRELVMGDPYYNPNLSLECDDFSYRKDYLEQEIG